MSTVSPSSTRRVTVVWLALMLITCVSWVVGAQHNLISNRPIHAAALLIVLALFKARLVIIHFMEVGHAPPLLRLACEAWVLVTCVALITVYARSIAF